MDEAKSMIPESREELFVIRQLPVIEDWIKEQSESIKLRCEEASKLACTEENLQEIKKTRAELNKEFARFEDARKTLKKQVMAPYDAFEATYKKHISEAYGKADVQLRGMVENTEYHLRLEKEKEIRRYFTEHRDAAGLPGGHFPFEKSGIKVLLSRSDKSLKTEAKAWIDARAKDLTAIDGMENPEAIYAEYLRTMDLAAAVASVQERKRAEEAARAERERREQQAIAVQPEPVEEPVTAAAPVPVVVDPAEEKVLTLRFTVRGTRTKLKALKQFLIDGGYEYE